MRKLLALALVASFSALVACNKAEETKPAVDSTVAAPAMDSTKKDSLAAPAVDTTKKDTVKADTAKKAEAKAKTEPAAKKTAAVKD
jgi:hypothetical protein